MEKRRVDVVQIVVFSLLLTELLLGRLLGCPLPIHGFLSRFSASQRGIHVIPRRFISVPLGSNFIHEMEGVSQFSLGWSLVWRDSNFACHLSIIRAARLGSSERKAVALPGFMDGLAGHLPPP